jgi:FKBP-type peptidyl-prolyl cis-trans isomerase FkpA
MKRTLITILLFFSITSFAQIKDSIIYYSLPDSVKVVSFLAEIKINSYSKKMLFSTGIVADSVSLAIQNFDGKIQISFDGPAALKNKITGLHVEQNIKFGEMMFKYNWNIGESYKLLISQAADSADNFSLYSGYFFSPKENKWKLIGTMKIEGRSKTLQNLKLYYVNVKSKNVSVSVGQVWCQRQNGSWKNMLQTSFAPPVVNLYSHVDSLEQLQIDKKLITQAVAENKTDVKNDHDGIYYTILKEGNGRQVSVNDTVTVFYKGYLFSDNSVFDQTKDKPATFPLKRLIVGWQIGVPLCKVGGKIKIIIPSNLGYSIRTRSAKIPPNSILVFEIEVVDAKSPQ